MNGITIGGDTTVGGESSHFLANRYRIVRQLGQGGMGSVWLAEDMKLDGHRVAIKMLPSVLVTNKRAYKQVKQEALVALRLSHPNIVTVRAFEEESGNPFLVMDYIDGITLDDYLCERDRLEEEEAVCLLGPIAEALDYAHKQGVIHRDVKPANIMVDKRGIPYVLDFGIAREIQETLTRVTGKLSSGTLLYMSPEQLNGDAPQPSQDVYSFAAMVYECLTGAPPFVRGAIEDQIRNKQPGALPANVSIGDSILRGLSKDPALRPLACRLVLQKKVAVASVIIPQPVVQAPIVAKEVVNQMRQESPVDDDSIVVCATLDGEEVDGARMLYGERKVEVPVRVRGLGKMVAGDGALLKYSCDGQEYLGWFTRTRVETSKGNCVMVPLHKIMSTGELAAEIRRRSGLGYFTILLMSIVTTLTISTFLGLFAAGCADEGVKTAIGVVCFVPVALVTFCISYRHWVHEEMRSVLFGRDQYGAGAFSKFAVSELSL